LVNLKCEPQFEYEQDDLFQDDMEKNGCCPPRWRLTFPMRSYPSIATKNPSTST
jgi:hypothetical protein